MNYKQKIGEFGEKLAKNHLIRHGYKIIDANIKISYQEIDIIAQKGKRLIFIEVKTRTSLAFGSADTAMTAKKIGNLKKAILIYINRNNNFLKKLNQPVDANFIRLDLISIDINKKNKTAKIKHYRDIF